MLEAFVYINHLCAQRRDVLCRRQQQHKANAWQQNFTKKYFFSPIFAEIGKSVCYILSYYSYKFREIIFINFREI